MKQLDLERRPGGRGRLELELERRAQLVERDRLPGSGRSPTARGPADTELRRGAASLSQVDLRPVSEAEDHGSDEAAVEARHRQRDVAAVMQRHGDLSRQVATLARAERVGRQRGGRARVRVKLVALRRASGAARDDGVTHRCEAAHADLRLGAGRVEALAGLLERFREVERPRPEELVLVRAVDEVAAELVEHGLRLVEPLLVTGVLRDLHGSSRQGAVRVEQRVEEADARRVPVGESAPRGCTLLLVVDVAVVRELRQRDGVARRVVRDVLQRHRHDGAAHEVPLLVGQQWVVVAVDVARAGRVEERDDGRRRPRRLLQQVRVALHDPGEVLATHRKVAARRVVAEQRDDLTHDVALERRRHDVEAHSLRVVGVRVGVELVTLGTDTRLGERALEVLLRRVGDGPCAEVELAVRELLVEEVTHTLL